MAILLVRIEDLSSLPLNEFFDYNGRCYALTRSRASSEEICIDLEDFYEASFQSQQMADIPVVFVSGSGDTLSVVGWYRKATIYKKVHRLTLFFEGNIIAGSGDAVLLPKPEPLPQKQNWIMGSQLYEVLEQEDIRYEQYRGMMDAHDQTSGGNAFLRYPYAVPSVDAAIMKSYDACIRRCSELAARVMQNECSGIRELRELEAYAGRASSIKRGDADGHYYLAMACDQLGFPKQGIKAIQKALSLEPDAPDLHGEKASLLVSLGYLSAAAEEYQRAFDLSGEEDYLLLEGRVYLMDRQPEMAMQCFRSITDGSILEQAGIQLKSLERRFPFISIRGFHNLFQ